MSHKQFKIGEYCMGGILDVTTNNNEVTIKCLDWDTKEVLQGRIFDINGVDSQLSIDLWLNELTTSYYSGVVLDYIKKNVTLKEFFY